jgi:hypothetical protein
VDTTGDGNGDLTNATVDTIALSVSSVGVEVAGIATLTVSGQMGLARVTPDGGTAASYTALKMGNVTVSGDVTLGIDLTAALTVYGLDYNATTTTARLDWTSAFDLDGDGSFGDLLDPGAALPTPADLTIDFDAGIELRVSGALEGTGPGNQFLSVAGVSLSGSVTFAITLRTVDLDTEDNVQLTTFALGIEEPVTLGVEGPTGPIEASITAGELAIATITLTDGTEYFALKAKNLAATVTGVPGLTGALTDVTILINKATGTGSPAPAALDWTTRVDLDPAGGFSSSTTGILDPGQDLVPPRSLPIDFTGERLLFSAVVEINLFDIITIKASFALSETTVDVNTDTDLSTAEISGAKLTTYAVSIDPTADPEQYVRIEVGGIGVEITSGDVVIAVVENETNGDSYFAVKAEDIQAEILGLPDSIRIYITGVSVEFNSASSTSGPLPALDWTKGIDYDLTPGFQGPDTVDPGQDLPAPKALPITSTSDRFRVVAGGAVDIGPGNVIAVIPAGGLVLDLGVADITTGNGALGTLTDAKLTVFTVTGADLFVGSGAELNATLDGINVRAGEGSLTADAVGFSVSEADFALASVTAGLDRFTGIRATVGNAALLGIDGLDLAVSGTVALNTTSRPDGEKIDWATATTDPVDLLPDLGITADQELSVIAGASLNIGGFVVATVPLDWDGVTVTTGLTLDMATVDFATGNTTLGTLLDVKVLSFSVKGASLFVGTGGVLDAGSRSLRRCRLLRGRCRLHDGERQDCDKQLHRHRGQCGRRRPVRDRRHRPDRHRVGEAEPDDPSGRREDRLG